MRFEVETGARRRTIEVERSAAGWVVTLDGRRIDVDFAPAGDRWSMLMRPTALPGAARATSAARSYEVAIEGRGQGRHRVHVGGRAVGVTLGTPGRLRSRAGSSAADATGPVTVTAPMPGRVARLLVAPGDAVAARQGLVVVEAMKMENELRAPRAGTVAQVHVREGEAVEANVVLVVIT